MAKAGIAVPKPLAEAPGLLILEDLGDETLDRHVADIRESCAMGSECGHAHGSPMLHQVMELLAAFHRAEVGGLELEPPFDAALYAWEWELYERHVAPFPAEAKAELARVRETLLAEPTVLVHRDFQSSNILLHGKRPWVIDFQGMRRGPAVYDLASFLFDPYVEWGDAARADALGAYAKASGRDVGALRRVLPLAGVQRLTQALGAYHRLAGVGQTRFLAYVPAARARAAALAREAGLGALEKAFQS